MNSTYSEVATLLLLFASDRFLAPHPVRGAQPKTCSLEYRCLQRNALFLRASLGPATQPEKQPSKCPTRCSESLAFLPRAFFSVFLVTRHCFQWLSHLLSWLCLLAASCAYPLSGVCFWTSPANCRHAMSHPIVSMRIGVIRFHVFMMLHILFRFHYQHSAPCTPHIKARRTFSAVCIYDIWTLMCAFIVHIIQASTSSCLVYCTSIDHLTLASGSTCCFTQV